MHCQVNGTSDRPLMRAEIEVKSMESKIIPGLYFAGEVMDIDGITGGFNFQAAWTTGFIAGKNAASG